jgi:ribosome recycling factor
MKKSNYTSPRLDKTIDWLNKSRDDWKSKTLETKSALKVAKQARKRAEASRQQWKEHCKHLEADQAIKEKEHKQKDAEIETLRKTIAQLEQENDILKKKPSFRQQIPM